MNILNTEIVFLISIIYAILIYIPTFILLFKKKKITHTLLLTILAPLSTYLLAFKLLPYGIFIYFIVLGVFYYSFLHKKYKKLDKKSQKFINFLFIIPSISLTINHAVFHLIILFLFSIGSVYYYYFTYAKNNDGIKTTKLKISIKFIILVIFYFYYFISHLYISPLIVYGRTTQDPRALEVIEKITTNSS
jgi:hypothetical protein